MPREKSHRRQGIRDRRRRARRSLSLLFLDDDLIASEEDYARLLQVEAIPRREAHERFQASAGADTEDQ